MESAEDVRMILVTAPDAETGGRIARAVVMAKVAACVNVLPAVESHYCWEGRLECSREVLLLMKTTAERVAALEERVVAEHPYDTPEFVVIKLSAGNERYLAWLRDGVRE
jgi:periplasmic divalent cation tolerance protein